MKGISPMLWFDHQAEEAAKHYTSVFKNSKIKHVSHYGDGAPMPKGTVMVVAFELNGQEYLALNGGPMFKFSEAISFVVNCENQEEIDYYWEKLSADGTGQCGWTKDKFGLSWQIVPTALDKLLSDPTRSPRVMAALMKMKKLDIKKLEEA